MIIIIQSPNRLFINRNKLRTSRLLNYNSFQNNNNNNKNNSIRSINQANYKTKVTNLNKLNSRLSALPKEEPYNWIFATTRHHINKIKIKIYR